MKSDNNQLNIILLYNNTKEKNIMNTLFHLIQK
jgi:hypothetical protein